MTEKTLRRSNRLAGLPVTPVKSSAASSASEVEFCTPEITQVFSNPLATPEEEEDIMPFLPDPPVFYGEAGKDNMPAFVHELKMWCGAVSCNSVSLNKVKLSGFMSRAFPYESQAFEWYEEN